MSEGPQVGRRATDRLQLDPVVEAYVEKRLVDTRHEMRNEFGAALLGIEKKLTEMQAQIASSALQSTREHVENRAAVDRVEAKVDDLKPVVERVAKLERHDDIDEAQRETKDDLRAQLTAARRWAAGLAVALLAVAIPAAISLIHNS